MGLLWLLLQLFMVETVLSERIGQWRGTRRQRQHRRRHRLQQKNRSLSDTSSATTVRPMPAQTTKRRMMARISPYGVMEKLPPSYRSATPNPSQSPTTPSESPTAQPVVTATPSRRPSLAPVTSKPTTAMPSRSPVTPNPTTDMPSRSPVTPNPTTEVPSVEPSQDPYPSSCPNFDFGETSNGLLDDNELGSVLFQPGNFSLGLLSCDGRVRLSNGLAAQPLAHAGLPVRYANGSVSSVPFHIDPDGAAVFAKPNPDDGWYYVSNAEEPHVGSEWFHGGVGSIEFDGDGRVVGYQRVANRLRMNCGGGRTPWNTWATCEEIGRGMVHQVDPTGARVPASTAMGGLGSYESFAYDDGTSVPTFYVTRDATDGVLTRFIPNDQGMACYTKPMTTTGGAPSIMAAVNIWSFPDKKPAVPSVGPAT